MGSIAFQTPIKNCVLPDRWARLRLRQRSSTPGAQRLLRGAPARVVAQQTTKQQPQAQGQTLAPALSRRYASLLPPITERETVLEEYAPGLWGLVQPFELGLDIRLRCVVARLQDGSLLLHNPVAPTEEMLALLEGLGAPVSAVLVSSNSPEHWLYTPAVLDKFPQAQLWVAPGLFDRLLSRVLWLLGLNKLYPRAKVLGRDPGPLDGQVSAAVFANLFTVECGVLLSPWRALLVSDAAMYMDVPGAPAPLVAGARAAGVWQRLGSVTRQLFEQFPQDGKKFVEEVDAQDFDLILPAHGVAPAPVERQGGPKDAWRDCFDYLLSDK